jgi:hypothetical protein
MKGLILSLLLAVIFFSCSDNRDNNPVSTPNEIRKTAEVVNDSTIWDFPGSLSFGVGQSFYIDTRTDPGHYISLTSHSVDIRADDVRINDQQVVTYDMLMNEINMLRAEIERLKYRERLATAR